MTYKDFFMSTPVAQARATPAAKRRRLRKQRDERLLARFSPPRRRARRGLDHAGLRQRRRDLLHAVMRSTAAAGGSTIGKPGNGAGNRRIGFMSSKRVTPNSMRKVWPSKIRPVDGIGKGLFHVGAIEIPDRGRRGARHRRRRPHWTNFLSNLSVRDSIGFLSFGRFFVRDSHCACAAHWGGGNIPS